MKTFTDNAGRTWTIQVNVDAVKRVKTLKDVDLMEVLSTKLLDRLMDDPVLLCDVIYSVCKPEADAKSISDEDFGRSMAGDAIDLATMALMEELVDFFPTRRRAVLTQALKKLRQFDTLALQAATDRLSKIDLQTEMDKALAKLDAEMLPPSAGTVSTPPPESLASTPAP